ncbi:NAD(P)-binding domain-containing protein [Spirochaeta lutea]|uniref:NAD(P)-binding domain-containing protein n=1 Tax=Spirochaeta lutea TaxID=1480694 RepID=UPI0006914957|nr:NAD(P)-binding domain-containing protein [Spirochaeta lutea]
MVSYDAEVILIGAGPVGIEVAGVLHRAGVDYIHLEAGQIGQTLMAWPRNTQFFSSPEWVALSGIPIQTASQGMITGEEYLAYMRAVVETLGLRIHTYQQVTRLEQLKPGFRVTTQSRRGQDVYQARYVILAQGDMSLPNELAVPGEDLPHVTHLFNDPHQYFQQRLLIVGGRNSALEAALRCWRAGAKVSMSYRGPEFDKNTVISRLHLEIQLLILSGQIQFYPQTQVKEITPEYTVLKDLQGDSTAVRQVASDFVYLATGFKPDQSLFTQAGCTFQPPNNAPSLNPETMETSVPGLYAAGTATAGNQNRYRVYIATCHNHGTKILRAIRPDLARTYGYELDNWVGNTPSRDYPVHPEELE